MATTNLLFPSLPGLNQPPPRITFQMAVSQPASLPARARRSGEPVVVFAHWACMHAAVD